MPPATLYRHEFLMCPHCGEQSGCRVDHLYDGGMFSDGFGPWYCHECKGGIEGKVIAPGNVEIWKSTLKRSFTRSMALLKLEGKDGTVYFVMDHDRYHETGHDTEEDNQDHQRYFFEEHSCPSNWLRECVAVIVEGDCDPHGFLEFVRAADVPRDFDVDDDSNWPALFPEVFEEVTIDGDVARVPGITFAGGTASGALCEAVVHDGTIVAITVTTP